jgi:hypothetical protein
MLEIARNILARRASAAPWDGGSPVREELFGAERLEQHAESLAAAQPVLVLSPVRLPALNGEFRQQVLPKQDSDGPRDRRMRVGEHNEATFTLGRGGQ